MSQTPIRAERAPAIEALRRQFFDSGQLPAAGLPASVLRSWQRCQRLGMENTERGRPSNTTRGDLMVARERNAELLSHAGGVMEHLYEQIRASGSMVLLADASGLILHGIGDPAFVDRASRVALQPGASWSECQRGTNAIGATLIERAPVEIFGAEHYLECNGVLTCSAAPIFGCHGEVLGALDISGDHRNSQPHTLGLARMGVRLVERRMFESEHARHAIFAFHPRPEGVGGLQEGLLAVDADGEIVAADRQARTLLGIEPGRSLGLGGFGNLFRSSFGTVIGRAARDPGALMALELRSGVTVYARVRVSLAWHIGLQAAQASGGARAARTPDPSRSARNRVTLQTLATGDAGLQLALDRCAKVVGRNIPILIQGESGSGKELLARACHNSGPRADGPFVAVNCAAIPENLIESELFGYVGGAFTGARREGAVGKVQQAHGGTLFLDEIGDMPLAMQTRLLRVLQERSVTPVGGLKAIPVDISLVCATHRVLRDAVANGDFREDLYYRVNGLTVTLPPLRERSDVSTLVDRLLQAEARESGRDEIRISPEVRQFFLSYAWPGNIRQLHSVIRVSAALLDDDEDEIGSLHLPEELFGSDPLCERNGQIFMPANLSAAAPAAASASSPAVGESAEPAVARSLDELELEAIAAVMREVKGNVSAAARRLGVSRNTLYRKLGRMS